MNGKLSTQTFGYVINIRLIFFLQFFATKNVDHMIQLSTDTIEKQVHATNSSSFEQSMYNGRHLTDFFTTNCSICFFLSKKFAFFVCQFTHILKLHKISKNSFYKEQNRMEDKTVFCLFWFSFILTNNQYEI